MAPRPRFSLLKKEKQETILDSAADEFGVYGYDGASINRIIKNAGISKGVAYYYFDNKKDLFATVIEYSFDKLAVQFGKIDIESTDASNFWTHLETYSLTGMEMLREHLWVHRAVKLFWHYVDTHPDSIAVRSVWANAHKDIEAIIVHGQKLGVVRTDIPNDLLITMIFSMGAAMDRWLFDNINTLDEVTYTRLSTYLIDSYRKLTMPVEKVKTATKKQTRKKKAK